MKAAIATKWTQQHYHLRKQQQQQQSRLTGEHHQRGAQKVFGNVDKGVGVLSLDQDVAHQRPDQVDGDEHLQRVAERDGQRIHQLHTLVDGTVRQRQRDARLDRVAELEIAKEADGRVEDDDEKNGNVDHTKGFAKVLAALHRSIQWHSLQRQQQHRKCLLVRESSLLQR